MSRELLQQTLDLLSRYRYEVPLGNMPHMIAHKTDIAIASIRAELAKPVRALPTEQDVQAILHIIRPGQGLDEIMCGESPETVIRRVLGVPVP